MSGGRGSKHPQNGEFKGSKARQNLSSGKEGSGQGGSAPAKTNRGEAGVLAQGEQKRARGNVKWMGTTLVLQGKRGRGMRCLYLKSYQKGGRGNKKRGAGGEGAVADSMKTSIEQKKGAVRGNDTPKRSGRSSHQGARTPPQDFEDLPKNQKTKRKKDHYDRAHCGDWRGEQEKPKTPSIDRHRGNWKREDRAKGSSNLKTAIKKKPVPRVPKLLEERLSSLNWVECERKGGRRKKNGCFLKASTTGDVSKEKKKKVFFEVRRKESSPAKTLGLSTLGRRRKRRYGRSELLTWDGAFNEGPAGN